MFYRKHYVSVKVALYSGDKQKVLIMKYSHGQYGLPGGHLDARELPVEAIARELMEELGIEVGDLKPADFFLHDKRGSAVILAYSGATNDNLVLNPTRPNHEIGVWMTRSDLESINNIASEYKRFVFGNWPR